MNKSSLLIKSTPKTGRGLFASKLIKSGDLIINFSGDLITYDEIEDDSYTDHHCIQIDKNLYLGPTGKEEDFVNHSCNPNAGIKLNHGKYSLFAIKAIEPGTEITFDYSTCMDEHHSEYKCACEDKKCRGKIQDFQLLSHSLKRKYLKMGIVMPFIALQFK